ncbi:hypothetical protein CYMTET_35929, partial [Cymbomonas tetramitiformis]
MLRINTSDAAREARWRPRQLTWQLRWGVQCPGPRDRDDASADGHGGWRAAGGVGGQGEGYGYVCDPGDVSPHRGRPDGPRKPHAAATRAPRESWGQESMPEPSPPEPRPGRRPTFIRKPKKDSTPQKLLPLTLPSPPEPSSGPWNPSTALEKGWNTGSNLGSGREALVEQGDRWNPSIAVDQARLRGAQLDSGMGEGGIAHDAPWNPSTRMREHRGDGCVYSLAEA